jgi:uncharacterized membrane protein YhaH (DUF805 family)
MTPAQSIKTCLRKYASISGRASRSEFWWFAIFSGVYGFLVLVMSEKMRLNLPDLGLIGQIAQSVGLIALLLLIAPNAAAFIRRYHDAGYTEWLPLTLLILSVLLFQIDSFIKWSTNSETDLLSTLFVGASCLGLSIAFFLIRPSQPHSNQFGPNPHEVTP